MLIREGLRSLIPGVIGLLFGWLSMRAGLDFEARWVQGGPDMLLHYGIATSAVNVFPLLPNGQFGFPGMQNLLYVPLFDPVSGLTIWVLGQVGLSGVAAMNLYSLLSFGVIALTGYVFFRILGLSWPSSSVWAVVFATLPEHAMQLAFGHPFMANYWVIPVIGIALLEITRSGSTRWTAWLSVSRRRRVLSTIALAAAIGLSQSYFFVFGIILLGGAWMVSLATQLARRRGLRDMVWPSILLASTVAVIVVQLAVLSFDGVERIARYFAARTPGESEYYAGKLVNLLLPWSGTGFPWVGDFAQTYNAETTINSGVETPSAGIIAVISLAAAITLTLVALLEPRMLHFRHRRAARALLFAINWLILFYVVSGLGVVFATIVSPEVRAWSRLSIMIWLFSIAVLALLADGLARSRLRKLVGLVIVIVIVIVDHGVGVARNAPAVTSADTEVRAYARALSYALPEGCGVVQIPLVSFPEAGPVAEMGDYEHFLPSLYAERDLRWSYGAARGTRSAEYWDGADAPSNFAQLFQGCAVSVDTAGYADDSWKQWIDAIGLDPDQPAVESGSKRWRLFVVDGL